MSRLALAGMTIFAGAMFLGMELGCRPKSQPSDGLPPKGDTSLVQELRQSYQRIHPGTRSLLIGFGVGFSWGGCAWTETWAG